MPTGMARLRDMLSIKIYCAIYILWYNLDMIEHLRNGSIVKVTPTDSKESYFIVRVTEIFDQDDMGKMKGIVGVYKTYCLGRFLDATVGGYPMPDMSGAFLEETNSFEVLSY
tara:strand:- start:56 stop:391 length:336 start_codon:yes stop_codon:yes gene_type:complete